MANEKKLVDRRKHKRFQVKAGGVGVLTPRWPKSTIVGDILDISSGGLALRYITDEVTSNRPSELTIVCANPAFYLHRLPIKAVSDFEIAKAAFGSMVPRRLCLQFGELSPDQTSHLKDFIINHTTYQH